MDGWTDRQRDGDDWMGDVNRGGIRVRNMARNMGARSFTEAMFTRRTMYAKHEFSFCGRRGDCSIKRTL